MKTKHVCLAFEHNNKADRDRLSGILRFASTVDDWELKILDAALGGFNRLCRKSLAGWRVDALVCSNARLVRTIRAAASGNAPMRVALMDCLDPAVRCDVSLELDADAVSRAAIELLRNRGYREIAFAGTNAPAERKWAAAFELAFVRTATAMGIAPYVFRTQSPFPTQRELAALSGWLRALPKPCGIMAYSDSIGRTLIDACHVAHVIVPGQVAILGMDDDSQYCESSRPSLSSIMPDFEMSGFVAAQLIDKSLRQHGRQRTVTNYGVKYVAERTSTQDTHGYGRITTSALMLLRESAFDKSLRVADIARSLNVSARLLEINFKKVVGHTVKQELTALRLEALRQKLAGDTSRTVSEICGNCGFRSVSAAGIAFRKRFKTTMREYRERQQNLN